MTLRRYIVWTLGHWLTYVGGGAFVAALTAWFMLAVTAEYTTVEKLPALLVPAGWAYASWRLYRARRAYADRIVGVTVQGVNVMTWSPGMADFVSGMIHGIAAQVAEVANFWLRWETTSTLDLRVPPLVRDRIADYLNGLTLELVFRDEPLIDHKHGVVARGLTYPKRCVVQVNLMSRWPDGVSRGDVLPTWRAEAMRLATDEMWALIRHELAHACLNALNVPQAAQHQVMKEAGFADA